MTDKQPEALRLADALDYYRQYDMSVTHTGIDEQTAALLRTQHAALERKDALLRKCLKHVASNISMTSNGTEAEDLYDAITSELAK